MLEYQKACELEKLNGISNAEFQFGFPTNHINLESETPETQLFSAFSFSTSSNELDSIVLPSSGMIPKDIKVLINGVDDSLLKIVKLN